ncbi:Ferric enterobactin receptor precursor [Aquimixticola soesokkakensis]|uniref:Ferric enterobactin receptor n=1 Tax=Aquimixticola soesokkakensis TaxID=1519096 RepID=A0A1Y5T6A6_9RHOB|nr:FepA family TonB-dependent siderophore receptor [Aquimixticola soesokkakensis]SLN56887.1 Ferric enterobactin receptor precursor [Aquimixticola soesokkakensis]
MGKSTLLAGTALSLVVCMAFTPTTLHAQTLDAFSDDDVIVLDPIYIESYEEAVLQALGVSTISAEQLERTPVANDISEIVRKMPGVNLTGTSSSGQRGNNRQIDIRGMGPENTLILIDGKPVLSRTSVKVGRQGERDTRGDSNWVPAELIERIEVLRGPAAARYGSGSAGGVVNIITKKPETELVTLGLSYNQPQSDAEGSGYRANVMWAKPLSDTLTMRLTGNYNHTNSDDPDINAATCEDPEDCSAPAGSEGVINKDVTALFTWTPDAMNKFDFEYGYSRQGNIYAGDTQLSNPDETSSALAEDGAETNRMERFTTAITHTGDYGWGETNSYVQYEHTKNERLQEGTAGSTEGRINSTSEWNTSGLDVLTGKSEAIVQRSLLGKNASVTVGAEVRYERLDLGDYNETDLSFEFEDVAASAEDRDTVSDQLQIGAYAESNIEWNERLMLTPSLRVDWADTFGTNVSGGLNMAYELSPDWSLKGGVARAYKAPGLYQQSSSYIYNTRGNGCAYPYYRNGPCYVLGNEDLDPETSINSEIGVAYDNRNGLAGTLTYFHNDYHDKIQSGMTQVATLTEGDTTYRVYQWENIPNAKVSGLEGSLSARINDDILFSTNMTYMLESEQELELEDGSSVKVPLSLVPDYTINASVEWQATDRLSVTPSITHYGRIDAAQTSAATGYANDDTDSRDPYTLVNLALAYELSDRVNLSGGVTNVFDTTILRSGDGANTYNEPGRAVYIGLNANF